MQKRTNLYTDIDEILLFLSGFKSRSKHNEIGHDRRKFES